MVKVRNNRPTASGDALAPAPVPACAITAASNPTATCFALKFFLRVRLWIPENFIDEHLLLRACEALGVICTTGICQRKRPASAAAAPAAAPAPIGPTLPAPHQRASL